MSDAYEIRHLKWKRVWPKAKIWRAETIIGVTYCVSDLAGSALMSYSQSHISGQVEVTCKSLDDAKYKAEMDYTKRLRKALKVIR